MTVFAHDIRFAEAAGILVAQLTVGRRYPAGRATVTCLGSSATLNDIVIFPRAIRPVGLTRLVFWEAAARPLRGQGLGTSLVSALCDHLALRGITELRGEMSGDLPRLARWYRGLGFAVDQEHRTIRIELPRPAT